MICISTRRMLSTAALLMAVASLLPACDSENEVITPDPMGTVRGFVRHRYSLAPIVGATVGCGARSCVADAEGRFEFANVLCDTTEITATFPGYEPLTMTYEVGTFQTLMLDLMPIDALADVAGVVQHRSDGPVAATVHLGEQTATADGDGRWTLTDVPLGLHPLVVSHERYVSLYTTVVVWGDGQEISSTIRRDSTFTTSITADAGIRWEPTDDWENNYGDENPLSVSLTPRRSVLLAIPLSPGPEGAVVQSAILGLTGYQDGLVEPDSLSFEIRGVAGTWYETSVDAVNFPSSIQLPSYQIADVSGTYLDQSWTLDVTRLYDTSATSVLVTPSRASDPPMWVYSRESVTPGRRPRLQLTVRF